MIGGVKMKIRIKSIFMLVFITIFMLSLSLEIDAAQGEAQIITGIALEGNNNISDQEILPLIETEVGNPLDEEKLKSDMQKIYELGYFQDVTISFKSYQGGLKAIFEFIEYPVINKIVIEGNESYPDEELLPLLDIEVAKVLNHNRLVEGRKKIEKLYQDNGYILAGFKDINVSDDGTLELQINEGYINDIIIKGNEKTKDFVILRELEFSKGDVLNTRQMQKSFQKLVNLNLFKDFNPQLERAEGTENGANIILEVAEAKTGNLGTGVSWSTKDGWLGFINIQERNLLGKGQTLGFDWKFGGVTNYSLSFYEPWLMGTETSFGISLYDKKSDGEDSEDGEYEEHRRGGSISLGHKLVEDWNGKVRFKIEDSTIDWIEDDKDGNEVVTSTEEASVRSLTLQVNRNTTNHPFNPTNGAVDTFSIEYAGQMLGGDHNFTKYNADFRRFYPGFKNQHAWGLRLNAGTAQGNVPELEKYRLGGSETLRGYDNGTFAGEDMLLMKLEYRFPIVENFTGVLFTDAGNTWDQDDKIDLENLHYSYGAGLRMNTPIGQIRLDYGFNEDGKGQPHFSIGQSF